MATLNELMEKFASPEAESTPTVADEQFVADTAGTDGTTKLASGGSEMSSLQEIYMRISDHDHVKTAQAAAEVPVEEEDIDFAKMAAAIADAEADEYVQATGESEGDIMKVASEYDAAGRIMARGFFDEFNKLAGNMDTDVTENQMSESESEAQTPALGDRDLPTVETNFAGTDEHDQKLEIGPNAQVKQVYADSLKPAKTISAGQGTGDDPQAMAESLGGGSPAGYATVRDLTA